MMTRRQEDSCIQWSRIPNTDYEASSNGDIRDASSLSVLKQTRHNHGYLQVRIKTVDGGTRKEYVHRLVCAAFHGEPPSSDYHADHIDCVRDNNASENLRWLKARENRARRMFAKGADHGSSKVNEEKVRRIRALANDNVKHNKIAEEIGISRRQVSDIVRGRYWSHVA